MKLIQVVGAELKLETLLQHTVNSLRHLLKMQTDDVIAQSLIFLREKRILRHQVRVKKGTVVSLLIPQKLLLKPSFQITSAHVVYEDNEVIVVDKPPGLPTQPTQKPGEDHLFGAVISFLTERQPGKLAYVGLHHRLDRDTSGLVLMTKKTSANKSISDQFRERSIHKKYLAISQGESPKDQKWKVEAPIRRVYGTKEFRFGIDRKKGDEAITLFEHKKRITPELQLIECSPVTGRTHQIRIHLAHSQLPILGDRVYGVPSPHRMQLHAYKLLFKHPVSGKKIEVESSRKLEAL